MRVSRCKIITNYSSISLFNHQQNFMKQIFKNNTIYNSTKTHTILKNRSDKRSLRFSKSGLPEIEKAYATHYVGMAKLKRVRGTDGSADTEI